MPRAICHAHENRTASSDTRSEGPATDQPLVLCLAAIEQKRADPLGAVCDAAAGLARLPGGFDHPSMGGEMLWAHITSERVCAAKVLEGLSAAAFGERTVAGVHFVVVGHRGPPVGLVLGRAVVHAPVGEQRDRLR
jgi:hypothetical protein